MEHQSSVIVGMAAGFVVALLLVALLLKKKVLDITFDERQERARGKAFQCGFITLVVCQLLYGLTDTLFGRWCDALTGAVLCVAVALGVFAAVCIQRDAYLSLKERPKSILSTIAILMLANLFFGGMQATEGKLVENGVLTFRACNLIAAALLAVILVMYLGKYLKDRKGEAE